MDKARKPLMSALLGAAVFAFWMWLYPQGLNYQEQNQLFLFTWAYFRERLALPGGLADWLSEFLVQFFYYRWSGALILAILAVLLQWAVWGAAAGVHPDRCRNFYAISFIPSLLMLVYMGDMEVLVSFPVALVLAVSACPLFARAGWHRLWLIPLGWWLLGPVIVVPVLFSVLVGRKWPDLVLALFTGAVFFAGYRLLAAQYPIRDAFFGINYHRLRDVLPALQGIIPGITLVCVFVCSLRLQVVLPTVVDGTVLALLFIAAAMGVRLTYEQDAWEILAYDDLIRHERYQEVIRRAEKYQPRTAISACSVNFCLFMDRQLTSRFQEFYQCGTEGLVRPSIKDNVSDITSAELLWMMGMPNITLQYCFDLQESIQNGRRSGRFLSRIADCNIANGWYDRAERYLNILSHSLFYRKSARDRKAMIRDEARVAADPVYAYVRSVRFRDDFITVYDSLDLMMAILYNQNPDNFMAAEYYEVWQQLKGKEVAP
jgi:hypothetical protein